MLFCAERFFPFGGLFTFRVVKMWSSAVKRRLLLVFGTKMDVRWHIFRQIWNGLFIVYALSWIKLNHLGPLAQIVHHCAHMALSKTLFMRISGISRSRAHRNLRASVVAHLQSSCLLTEWLWGQIPSQVRHLFCPLFPYLFLLVLGS